MQRAMGAWGATPLRAPATTVHVAAASMHAACSVAACTSNRRHCLRCPQRWAAHVTSCTDKQRVRLGPPTQSLGSARSGSCAGYIERHRTSRAASAAVLPGESTEPDVPRPGGRDRSGTWPEGRRCVRCSAARSHRLMLKAVGLGAHDAPQSRSACSMRNRLLYLVGCFVVASYGTSR